MPAAPSRWTPRVCAFHVCRKRGCDQWSYRAPRRPRSTGLWRKLGAPAARLLQREFPHACCRVMFRRPATAGCYARRTRCAPAGCEACRRDNAAQEDRLVRRYADGYSAGSGARARRASRKARRETSGHVRLEKGVPADTSPPNRYTPLHFPFAPRSSPGGAHVYQVFAPPSSAFSRGSV